MTSFNLYSEWQVKAIFGNDFFEEIEGIYDRIGQFFNADEVRQSEWHYLYDNTPFADYFVHCNECGKIEYIDNIMNIDDNNYCIDCAKKLWYFDQLVKCCVCGNYFFYQTNYRYNGNHICEQCFEDDDNLRLCDDCGDVFDYDDLTEVASGDLVCEECLEDDYTECPDCGDYVHNDSEWIYITDTDERICRNCYENGNYFYCESCGDHFSERAYGGDGMCEDCYEGESEHDNLSSYSYKPRPYFHSMGESSKLYFGPENEFSFHDYRERNACLDDIQDYNFDDLMYFKEDSSLDYGIEVVGHPMTLNYAIAHKKQFKEFFHYLKNCGAIARDGLHVHVSRKNMTKAHQNRFGSFIYACQEYLMPIARREPNHYCQALDKAERGLDIIGQTSTASRYRMVNYQNYSTIELRIFHDTLDVREFLAAIEFTHAVYQFTKSSVTITQIIQDNDIWQRFVAYIAEDKRYSDLIYILNRSESIEKHLVEKADKIEKRIEKRRNEKNEKKVA